MRHGIQSACLHWLRILYRLLPVRRIPERLKLLLLPRLFCSLSSGFHQHNLRLPKQERNYSENYSRKFVQILIPTIKVIWNYSRNSNLFWKWEYFSLQETTALRLSEYFLFNGVVFILHPFILLPVCISSFVSTLSYTKLTKYFSFIYSVQATGAF